jgi:hypothetical protein
VFEIFDELMRLLPRELAMERIILAIIQVIANASITTKHGTEFRGVAAVLVASAIIISAISVLNSPEHLTQFISFFSK